MSTSNPLDIVQLPRLSTSAANALGQQMIAAADAIAPFPAAVLKARDRLKTSHIALQTAIVDQFGAGTAAVADEPAVQELDRILDNCWSGLDARLLGLVKLPPGKPGVAEAAVLRKRLFPAGLSFLKLPYKLQWSESQTRLDLIDRENLAPQIAKLAGPPFLPAIQEAHADYGKALGMSQPLAEGAAMPLVRGALDAFGDAMRSYVLKVLASVEDDDPATQITADALLAPLTSWVSASKRSTDEAPAAPPAEPDATGTP